MPAERALGRFHRALLLERLRDGLLLLLRAAPRRATRTRSASSSTWTRSPPPSPATPSAWGRSRSRTPIDPVAWVYDLGENGDLSLDATCRTTFRDLVAAFRGIPNGKGSFATKLETGTLLDYDPQGRTRIRFSLMPRPSREGGGRPHLAHRRAHRGHQRLRRGRLRGACQTSAGDCARGLGARMAGAVRRDRRHPLRPAKAQLKCEIIMLTHNEALHDTNLAWHPKGERPALAPGSPGDEVEPERHAKPALPVGLEAQMASTKLLAWHGAALPYCEVRYAF